MPVVVVDGWNDTFDLAPTLENTLDPGPAWVGGAGVVAGLALVIATHPLVVGSGWRLIVVIAGAVFVAAWALLVLGFGGTRIEGVAYSVATAAWMLAAWSLVIGSGAGWALAAVAVLIGVGGQLVATWRWHRLAMRRLEALRGLAHRGERTSGWIVAIAGEPWQRDLTLEAADGTGRSWSAEHTAWLTVRPTVGHPVGIWTSSTGDAVVALVPRNRPA
ncbi:MAG: hypothetical protein AAGC49_03180 [Brevundimonas sp.]